MSLARKTLAEYGAKIPVGPSTGVRQTLGRFSRTKQNTLVDPAAKAEPRARSAAPRSANATFSIRPAMHGTLQAGADLRPSPPRPECSSAMTCIALQAGDAQGSVGCRTSGCTAKHRSWRQRESPIGRTRGKRGRVCKLGYL